MWRFTTDDLLLDTTPGDEPATLLPDPAALPPALRTLQRDDPLEPTDPKGDPRMSTRSRIAIRQPDGSYRSIYCHFDGYPAGVGATLAAHYTDPAKVEQLMVLGDLSSLGPEIGEPHDFAAPLEAHPDWCRAYGRDRGDTGTEAIASQTFDDLVALTKGCWGEYLYIYADGTWHTADARGAVEPLDGGTP